MHSILEYLQKEKTWWLLLEWRTDDWETGVGRFAFQYNWFSNLNFVLRIYQKINVINKKINILLTSNSIFKLFPKEMQWYWGGYIDVHCHNVYKREGKWEQCKYPSVGEWVNKLWYISSMECYKAVDST